MYDEKEADEAITIELEFNTRKRTLAEMERFLSDEAYRIEGSERSRMIAGFADKPHPDQIERIDALMDVRRFIERCRVEPFKVIDWLSKRDAKT